jgi:lipooligosaccharide transport system ATP-binding protein
LQQIESIVEPTGLPTRRSGPAVSILRSEELPGDVVEALGQGAHRSTTLEDVFVLLTGQDLEAR